MPEKPIVIVKRGGTSAFSIGCGLLIGFVMIVGAVIFIPTLIASFGRIERAKAEIAAREERARAAESAAAPKPAAPPVEVAKTSEPAPPPPVEKVPENTGPPPIIWTPSSEPLKFRDIEISIVEIRLGKPRLFNTIYEREFEPDLETLNITVRVRNQSERRKIDAEPLLERFGDAVPTLLDDVENRYKLNPAPSSSRFVGATIPIAIYPGKEATDVLCFERPVDGFKGLTLAIPLQGVGLRTEIARFRIDPSDVKR